MIEDTGEIGKQLALVAAVAAAMQLFLAPTIHAQIEALQSSGLVPSRLGGVAANVLGVVYGLCLGALGMLATSGGDVVLLVVGFVAGLVAGGGAVMADQGHDGLMARKLEKAEVTKPPVLTSDDEPEGAGKRALVESRTNGAKPSPVTVVTADTAPTRDRPS